jgi:hypothetical protein
MAAPTFYQVPDFMMSDNAATKMAQAHFRLDGPTIQLKPRILQRFKLLTALIVHPTANKKRAREEFDALVLLCLLASLKHNAAYIIADFYCTGSVFVP